MSSNGGSGRFNEVGSVRDVPDFVGLVGTQIEPGVECGCEDGFLPAAASLDK